jgi:penicillin-binding protein 2
MRKDYSGRKYFILAFIVVLSLLFMGRLFFLQVVDESYLLSAESNVLRKITKYPARGLIYDRNGELLVYNQTAYDVMVIPRRVQAFDTLELAGLLGVDKEYITKQLRKVKSYSYFKPSVFLRQISKKDYAYLEEKLYKFTGFYVQTRYLRNYTYPAAAHSLGYVGEVNNRHLQKDAYYQQGDYIGVSGLEGTYEKVLRGKKGLELVMVDVLNREKGTYKEGKYDTAAVKGHDLYTTLDIDLQRYGEKLMQNKIGSIVALEPGTGEILALVSSPSYDPNLLVGRVRGENYTRLNRDSLNPLFNRALMAQYPPGSSFKPVNAIVGLQTGAITRNTQFACSGVTEWPIKCSHNHKSPLNLPEAIEQSCNPYFWKTFNRIISSPAYANSAEGFNEWRKHVVSMGFNRTFNTDVTNEKQGFIPEDSYYDRYYKRGFWNSMTIRSLAIGQGEIMVTPLQLANFTATVANRGYYYPPHLLDSIEDKEEIRKPFMERHYTLAEPVNFEPVIEGMHRVFTADHGTARWYNIDTIPMAGKTGTVQNPHGDDHSIFIAFAPLDNPKIALSVIVENSGFGSRWAVPMATLMIEKYLNREISRQWVEDRMLEGDLINNTQEENDE